MQRILIPLDGSPMAELALGPAVALARRWQAEILLVRGAKPGGAKGVRPYLDRVASSLEQQGFQVRCFAPTGQICEQILLAASQQKADLMVLCSHGRSGIRRLLLGSVAESVLREATCPMLLVRPGCPPPDEAGFRRVLVPVDSSQLAATVVQEVAPYLAADGILTVVGATDQLDPDDDIHCRREIQEELDQAYPELPHRVLEGDAATSIVAFASETACDLIAMATHGRTGLRRVILGSVTEEVARHAACSVLAFPQAALRPTRA